MGLFRANTNKQTENKHKTGNIQKVVKNPNCHRPVGYIQSAAKELNSRQPRTNPVSSRVEGLNPGPPDYKCSSLTTRPRLSVCMSTRLFKELFNCHWHRTVDLRRIKVIRYSFSTVIPKTFKRLVSRLSFVELT